MLLEIASYRAQHPDSLRSMQILDNAVTNNEIYVMLCDSVQGMESQLQRLHSVLASLRTLSAELRFLAGRDGGGGESTNVVGTTGATTTQGGETSKLHRQLAQTTGNDFEPPELAQIVPVCSSCPCLPCSAGTPAVFLPCCLAPQF